MTTQREHEDEYDSIHGEPMSGVELIAILGAILIISGCLMMAGWVLLKLM